MANEQVTQLDPASKALAAAEAARKQNLAEGTDTVVPRGDETTPTAGGRDFANDRKAIFARSSEQRSRQIEADANGNGELQSYEQAMSDEMAVRLEAEAAGLDPEKAHREFVANGHQRPAGTKAPGQTPPPARAPAGQPPIASADAMVTLTHNGRQINVSQRDLDAVGGANAYLAARVLDEREGDLAAQVAEMQRREQALKDAENELNRRRAETQQHRAAGPDVPAIVPVGTQGQGNSPAASAESINAEAERLMTMMFSGDPADATKALAQIIHEARSNRQEYSAEQIAQLAAEKLRQTQPQHVNTQPKPQAEPAQVDPRWERQRIAINAMAKAEYSDVLQADPAAAVRVKDRITAMGADPRNKDRRAIDVAREALEIEKQEWLRTQRVVVKQSLPPAPAAGGAQAAQEGEKIATGSDYVALMADRRNFGRRTPR